MSTEQTSQSFTVAIVGGGQVGHYLFDLFYQSNLTRIAFVADKDPMAPAIVAAEKVNIPVFTDYITALANIVPDFIFEVTGSEKVTNDLRKRLDPANTELITHNMSYIILQVIEENRHKAQQGVSTEITGIKSEIDQSLLGVESVLASMDDINAEMQILAINARIEAARAGEKGKGFAVVAQQMARSVEMVHGFTKEIDKVNNNIKTVSNRIDTSLQRLN